MIGRLTGKILVKKPPELLLDVNGVGYQVLASMQTFYKLPAEGENISVHTHMVVREDAQLLYGFYDLQERSLFRTLIKVNGVGPKLALTILSSVSPTTFVNCVMDNDTASLIKLPGVGKKTAERLIVEMRDRLEDWQTNDIDLATVPDMQRSEITVRRAVVQDAISALISLGYRSQEASKVVAKVEQVDRSSEDMIREALKLMVS